MGCCGSALGCVQQLSLHATPSAKVSIGEDCRDLQWPRLWKRTVGLVGGQGCWSPPDLFFCHGKIHG